MELYRLWRILLGYKWILIGLPVVATLVGLGLAYALPEQYELTALVLVRPAEEIKFDSNTAERKEVMDFPIGQAAPIDAPSKTYMEVIKSPAVAARIVEALHLDVKKLPKEGRTEFEVLRDELKEWFLATLRTLKNYVRYGRDIPATSFDLAVENVEGKLDATVRKDTYAFDISFRSSDPNEAVAVANMAAQIFLERSSEEYHNEAAHAREFIKTTLDASRKTLEQARAAVLAYKNSGETFDLTSEYKEKMKNVSDLQTTLAKAEGKLAGLQRSFRQDSPEVLAQEAENASLRQNISTLQAQLVDYPEKEAKLNAILETERLAEASYEFFRRRYEEAQVKELTVETEIRIVSPAEPGLYPVKPLKYVYAGLSFAMGAVAALAWALLAEQFNPRVRTDRDLDGDDETPVLGAIPEMRRSSWTSRDQPV